MMIPPVLLVKSGRLAHAASAQATKSIGAPLEIPWIFRGQLFLLTSSTNLFTLMRSETLLWGVWEIKKPTSEECWKSVWPHNQLKLPKMALSWVFSCSEVGASSFLNLSWEINRTKVLNEIRLIQFKAKIFQLLNPHPALHKRVFFPSSPRKFILNLLHQIIMQRVLRFSAK